MIRPQPYDILLSRQDRTSLKSKHMKICPDLPSVNDERPKLIIVVVFLD